MHGREGGVEWSSVNSLKRSRSFGGIRAVGRGFPKGPVRLWMIYMQRIYPTSLTPEQYGEQEYHKQVKPPENCPNCQQAHILEGLAYYHRHGAGFADLGAPVSVSALSHQRQLPAAVCAAVSAGQYADHCRWV